MQEEYLSIGKVSKLKNISIKALRYYNEIGIFVPAYINPRTKYRYYSKEQLPILDAINLCVKLGIPLKTLPTYINNDSFDFSALLSDTQKLAEEKIQGIQLALDRIKDSCEAVIPNIAANTSANPQTKAQAASLSVPTPSSRLTSTYANDQYLVALPLSQEQLPPYDGFILKLFIFARQHNFTLENPSCLLYRYENSNWQKYLCLKLYITPGKNTDINTSVLQDAGFSLFKIPSGTYSKRLRTRSIETPSNTAVYTFGNPLNGYTISLLEQMVPDNSEYNFELINLETIKCNCE